MAQIRNRKNKRVRKNSDQRRIGIMHEQHTFNPFLTPSVAIKYPLNCQFYA